MLNWDCAFLSCIQQNMQRWVSGKGRMASTMTVTCTLSRAVLQRPDILQCSWIQVTQKKPHRLCIPAPPKVALTTEV